MIDAIQGLTVAQGPQAGQRMRLARFQRDWLEGFAAEGIDHGALSVARGAGKTTLSAGLAVTHLLGLWGAQPQREILVVGRTRDQAAILWRFACSFVEGMDGITIRRGAALEIELEAPDGPHLLKAMPAVGKAILGAGPTLVIGDERAAWHHAKAAEVEAALVTSLGKRSGRMVTISTSAPDAQHDFSRLLDDPPPGCFVADHRAPDGAEPDDWEALRLANPGSEEGVGSPREWLERAAQQAMARGGPALAAFRNLHMNMRVHSEVRELLVDPDVWRRCEVDPLPPRSGPVVIGIDLGGAASMTAAAWFWPQTGRIECRGWFPDSPSLGERGIRDAVGNRYLLMRDRGEMGTYSGRTVPVGPWIAEVLDHVAGETIAAVVSDRFRQSELEDGLGAAGVRVPLVWRGFGWRDGGEDVSRFQRHILDGLVKASESLLIRSALASAITVADPGGNRKLVKGGATARIDVASAMVVAVAEGQRLLARPAPRPARVGWA